MELTPERFLQENDVKDSTIKENTEGYLYTSECCKAMKLYADYKLSQQNAKIEALITYIEGDIEKTKEGYLNSQTEAEKVAAFNVMNENANFKARLKAFLK